MQQSIQASKNYAQALIELTNNDISLQESLFNEIKELNQIIANVKDAKVFFDNPAISKDDKKSLLNKTLSGKVNQKLLNFLSLLVDNQRFNLLTEIQNQYLILLNKSKGVVIAEVVSAHELDSSVVNAISEALKHTSTGQVKVETKIEPELIGGLKVKVGDLVYDGSIKGRLEGLKRRLG